MNGQECPEKTQSHAQTGPGIWPFLAAATLLIGLGALLLAFFMQRSGDELLSPVSLAEGIGQLDASVPSSGLRFDLQQQGQDEVELPSGAESEQGHAPSDPAAQEQRADEDEEAILAALIAEARAFREQHPQAGRSSTGLPSRQLIEDILAAEERQRSAEEGAAPQRLRLSWMLDPGSADQSALLAIHLENQGSRPLPITRGNLAIEGLDAQGQIIWNFAPAVPEAEIAAQEQWDWASPIQQRELPPAAVVQVRLRYHNLYSTPQDWTLPR